MGLNKPLIIGWIALLLGLAGLGIVTKKYRETEWQDKERQKL
jgi:hypothetical protein